MPPFTDRESGLRGVTRLLERAGFYLFDLHHVRPTPFDLIARRDSTLLLIKVLKNVDALDPQDATLLRTLAEALGAVHLVVGRATGARALQDSVLYSRHGVPILSLAGLEEYLLRGVPPFLFSSPGGKFVRIDGRTLRRAREARSLSLGAAADIAGVSRRTIQLYEQGGGADAEVVARLEAFLQVPLAAALDPFEEGTALLYRDSNEDPDPDRPPSTSVPAQVVSDLDENGWDVTLTIRTPFDALAREERAQRQDVLVMGVGPIESTPRRSLLLWQISRVAEGISVFLVPDRRTRTDVEGVPLVTYQELRRHADPQELRELLRERRRVP